MKIVNANYEDADRILSLYKEQLGKEFCAWNEHYPTMSNIEYDLSRNALFVMKDDNDMIVAAISIDKDEAVEELDIWSKELQPGGELARLAVTGTLQNNGIARQMMLYCMNELQKQGYKSVHILVNKYNIKALKSYAHLNMNEVGECYLYEQSYKCFEKSLV